MKSAYELAMERLAKADPAGSKPLTAEQKTRLAEVDTIWKGKIAEREIFLQQRLETALAEGKYQDAEQLQAQLKSERARLEEHGVAGHQRRVRQRRGQGASRQGHPEARVHAVDDSAKLLAGPRRVRRPGDGRHAE